MPRKLQVLLVSLVGVIASAGVALAAFPTDPPDDPMYEAESCPAQECLGTAGQWNLKTSSGISADQAWLVTTGRKDVVAAILDSGVDYDHEDLRNKIWLNSGEFPAPNGPDCVTASPSHDCNADGVFSVQDYLGDSRVTDSNASGAVDRGDFRVFKDGLDNDGNGYVDDLSGWDTDDNDGDEFDHRYLGHGTGRAGILAPETDNGLGVAGACPDCPMMNVRIDDTFVCNSDGVGKGAIYAVDNGATVINMSLGCTTASRFSRSAFDYATTKNVLAFNASANEFSFHQNFQSIFDDVISVGAVTANNRSLTTTFLQKASFSNYGAHLDVVAPSEVPGAAQGRSGLLPNHTLYTKSAGGTSSSTPHGAAVGALVFSRARDLIATEDLPVTSLALKDISAQEVRQIINKTADDVTPQSGTTYPVSMGWDKWTGYGRINAKQAVDLVAPSTIPPEADINSPDWYTLVDGAVQVRFYANARWATTFAHTLEFGQGVEPTTWTALSNVTSTVADPLISSANRVSNFTVNWPQVAALGNGLYTLKLRVTDNLGNTGEDRMAVWVRHSDPQDQAGFPKVLDGSIESLSVAAVDLDGDNKLEIIFGDGNGEVHAIRNDGSELAGFPVETGPLLLPISTSDAFDGVLANGEISISYTPIIGGPAVADLDRDGVQQVVVAGTDGMVYCWNADASVCAGFPVSTDVGLSRDPYSPHDQIPNTHPEGIVATPALGDLTGDGQLEIIVGSVDQKLYVWNSAGERVAPFPKLVVDPAPPAVIGGPGIEIAPRAILSSAAIADVDRDGINDIVVGTNETYSTPTPPPGGIPGSGSGRAYLIKANGTIAAGWPVKPTSAQPSSVPLVAQGVGTSPVVADVDGAAGGRLEVALAAFLGDATIYLASGETFRTMNGSFGTTGAGSKDLNETTPEGDLASASDEPGHFYVANGAFADVDGDNRLEYTAGTVGNRLLSYAASGVTGSGPPVPFDHLLSLWDANSGAQRPAFPRVMEDWQFLNSPSVADITGDGDTRPEIIDSSGGFFVHAFNALGLEAPGWPKNTGQWQTSTPSIADIDGDGDVEVIQTSRLGTLFVWSTPGAACQKDQWRKFRHDEWNTGNYHADTRRPAKIAPPVLSDVGDAISLRWTAVGDDAKCGTATSYELRASSFALTELNFGDASLVPTISPKVAGSPESLTFSPPAGTRFLALRAIDEAGNRGPLVVIPMGVLIAESNGSTNVTESGAVDTYTVVLDTQPTANVTVTPVPDSKLTVNPTTLVFTSATWSTPKTVTVTAVDDATDQAPLYASSISHTVASTDPAYNGLTGTLFPQVADNDLTGYLLDGSGGVHPFDIPGNTAPPPGISSDVPYWPGQDVARDLVMLPGGEGGYLLDRSGGIHRLANGGNLSPEISTAFPYWPDQDVARDLVMLPSGQGGYLLDRSGGVHRFATGGSLPPAISTDLPYWPNEDVARRIVILPGGDSGGYLLDRSGGVHRFATGGSLPPAISTDLPYWPGDDVARDLVILPGATGGYLLDRSGAIHRFQTTAGSSLPPAISGPFPYWPGQDVARGLLLVDDFTGGYLLDSRGGIHSFATGGASPPPVTGTPYFTYDIARGFAPAR